MGRRWWGGGLGGGVARGSRGVVPAEEDVKEIVIDGTLKTCSKIVKFVISGSEMT